MEGVQIALRNGQGSDPTNPARSSGAAEVQAKGPLHECIGADSLGAKRMLVARAASIRRTVNDATKRDAVRATRGEAWLGYLVLGLVGRLVGTYRVERTGVRSRAELGLCVRGS